jgi:hypothetical protein
MASMVQSEPFSGDCGLLTVVRTVGDETYVTVSNGQNYICNVRNVRNVLSQVADLYDFFKKFYNAVDADHKVGDKARSLSLKFGGTRYASKVQDHWRGTGNRPGTLTPASTTSTQNVSWRQRGGTGPTGGVARSNWRGARLQVLEGEHQDSEVEFARLGSDSDKEYPDPIVDIMYVSSGDAADEWEFNKDLLALQRGDTKTDPSTMVCYTAVRKGVCDKPNCPFIHTPAELDAENQRMIREL